MRLHTHLRVHRPPVSHSKSASSICLSLYRSTHILHKIRTFYHLYVCGICVFSGVDYFILFIYFCIPNVQPSSNLKFFGNFCQPTCVETVRFLCQLIYGLIEMNWSKTDSYGGGSGRCCSRLA